MRRRRTPLGWPRRDPRHYRFPVPNEVWEYKFRPTEFLILSNLFYWQAHDRGERKLCAQVVADALHLSAATVEEHLAALASKDLITTERSYWFNETGLKRNGNNVYTILPTGAAVEDAHQRLLRRVELDTARWKTEQARAKRERTA